MGAASTSQRDQFVAQAKALTATVKADKALAEVAALNGALTKLQHAPAEVPKDRPAGK